MLIVVTWRRLIVVFFLVAGVVAFPRATYVPWITTAEARPIPPRKAISEERLSLAAPEARRSATTGYASGDITKDDGHIGP